MKNIILFGPPGAGKGTQAEIITKKYNFIHISTGDVFRDNISKNTELGKLAKSFMDKGELVPDEVTIKMLRDVLEKNNSAQGYIFDGFPRTISQAKSFDEMLEEKNTKIDKFISLEVEDEILVKRLLIRGEDSGREDDRNENIIKNRIKEYYKKTAILKEFYNTQNKSIEVNGVGDLNKITQDISFIVENI